MQLWASVTSRSITSLAPASAWVGPLARPYRADPSSATQPTTRLVPPMSMPRTYRKAILRRRRFGHRPDDLVDREVPHAAVMDQRADLRTVGRAGAAAQGHAESPVAGSARPEPLRRHGRPEQRHHRRADRRGQVK